MPVPLSPIRQPDCMIFAMRVPEQNRYLNNHFDTKGYIAMYVYFPFSKIDLLRAWRINFPWDFRSNTDSR